MRPGGGERENEEEECTRKERNTLSASESRVKVVGAAFTNSNTYRDGCVRA